MRLLPYISLLIVTMLVYLGTIYLPEGHIHILCEDLLGHGVFFFIAYLFYDLLKEAVISREKKYLKDYIKNKVANDIFAALYYLKKIIHGYNLETNRTNYIISIVNYSGGELNNHLKNQSYLGFQIFKSTGEIRSLFMNALNDNLILKYSNHNECIKLLRISNNLIELERLLTNENNFDKSAESGIEFKAVNAKDINPTNDDGYILMKMTGVEGRFVVYDSGKFDKENVNKLLNRYVLKPDIARKVGTLLYETFDLMKTWLPKILERTYTDSRFRIIKDYFTSNTTAKTGKADNILHTADIIEGKKP